MVRRSAFRWTLVTVALFGARIASADPINFTGFVDQDFPQSNTSVIVVPVNSDPTNTIAQPSEMTNAGIVNGYAIKDFRFSYDQKTDTAYVGLNMWSIAGTAVGTGGQAMVDLITQHGANSFQDPAHLGGDKSILVAFAPVDPSNAGAHGAPVALAGVPSNKAAAGSGTDGFTVAKYAGLVNQGIQNQFGSALAGHTGTLAFDPSASHPDFEFTISNFSKIPGLNADQGFFVKMYAGSAQDGPIGEENTQYFKLPALRPQVPEPTTCLGWSLVAGAAAYRLRRRGRK